MTNKSFVYVGTIAVFFVWELIVWPITFFVMRKKIYKYERREDQENGRPDHFLACGTCSLRNVLQLILLFFSSQLLSYFVVVILSLTFTLIGEAAGILYQPESNDIQYFLMHFKHLGIAPTALRLVTSDGDNVWMYYLKGNSSGLFSDKRVTVVYTHGNSGNLASHIPTVTYTNLVKMGLDVYTWDPPGFGLSSGQPSYERIMSAAETVMNDVEKRNPDRQIVPYGRSLGGAVTAILASNHHYPGVILEVPLDSMPKLLEDFFRFTGYAMAAVWRDRFDAFDEIDKMKTCLFHYAASEDNLILDYRQKALNDKATNKIKNCSYFVIGAGKKHNDVPWSANYNDLQQQFLMTVSDL